MAIPSAFARYQDRAAQPPATQQKPLFTGDGESGQVQYRVKQPPQKQLPGDVAQHEIDLMNGPLLQELGVDFKMVVKKLKAALPGTRVPEDVAQYPEMVFGFIIIFFALVVGMLSRSGIQMFIPLMFGALVGGAVLFKTLIWLLLQGQRTVNFYNMLSAICYSLFPILVSWFVFGFFHINFSKFVLFSIPAAVYSAYILQKFLGAVLCIENIKMLVIIPAFEYSAFWLLLGRGLVR